MLWGLAILFVVLWGLGLLTRTHWEDSYTSCSCWRGRRGDTGDQGPSGHLFKSASLKLIAN